jgi:hypothetical protein
MLQISNSLLEKSLEAEFWNNKMGCYRQMEIGNS